MSIGWCSFFFNKNGTFFLFLFSLALFTAIWQPEFALKAKRTRAIRDRSCSFLAQIMRGVERLLPYHPEQNAHYATVTPVNPSGRISATG